MSGDSRLEIGLEALRVAFGAYLECLRSLWSEGSEAERVMSAAGARAEPTGAQREGFDAALAAIAAAEEGQMARLVGALGLAPAEELLVAAAWWAETDPQFAIALGCAHDDGSRRYPSAALLRAVLEPFGAAAPPALDDASPLVRFGVLAAEAGTGEPLTLTPTARRLLAGEQPAAMRAAGPVPARLESARQGLALQLASGRGGVFVLRGPAGVGRRALAVAACADAGLLPVAAGGPAPELRHLARVAAAVPLLPAAAVAELEWSEEDGPLLAWAAPGEPAPGYTIDLPAPSRGERAAIWGEAFAAAGLEGDPLAATIASRFACTEGDVEAVMDRAALDASWHGRQLDGERIWEAARRQPEHELDRLAALVPPAFTLEDLVLPEDTRAKLGELVAHVSLQDVVLEQWGFGRRLPRGQGVAALFAGPPGTGKTMAAEALADGLRQDLYRIDLSAVVSKYIGETEKNLAAAFDDAERAGAVLFFDEADALFGKRTQVKDAHDRYANLEVNYLLQRVESFTGLVVLATNRQAAIDDAFLRRLRFVIRFELPDAALRLRLWQRSFPPGAALGELPWEALAAAELSGGNIQSAALAAAYLAAAAGEEIGLAQVEHALRREHEKLGKAWAGLPAEALA